MRPRLLCFTHSLRAMDFSRATLNFLTHRYADPARLANPPPLATLPDEHVPHYLGNVTLWDWSGNPGEPPQLRSFLTLPYKAQHACVAGDKLLICGTSFLEVYPLSGPYDRAERVITHPWFAGAHTVYTAPDGRILVSCSAPDAVLFFSPDGQFLDAWRIPDSLYGRSYDLQLTDDLRAHYIGNDLQTGHINSAIPDGDGVLCSLLIPGAIGRFDRQGQYREIVRGYVGCHGARPAGNGNYYFSDSCNGLVVEITPTGSIRHRFHVESRWLHDALMVAPNLYICALSEHNTFELWNVATGEMHWRLACGQFGATTQFISEAPARK